MPRTWSRNHLGSRRASPCAEATGFRAGLGAAMSGDYSLLLRLRHASEDQIRVAVFAMLARPTGNGAPFDEARFRKTPAEVLHAGRGQTGPVREVLVGNAGPFPRVGPARFVEDDHQQIER